jgi:hypothetical protein
MEKDPFPLMRAALVSVFRAPLISRGLKVEKVVKRVIRPAMEIFLRSGMAGISFVIGKGLGLADILLLWDILCVPERVIEPILLVANPLRDPVCLAVVEPFTEVKLVAEGATVAVSVTDIEVEAE